MAAFPISTEPSVRTSIQPDSGKRMFTTMGGGIRGRNSYDQTYYRITMVDEALTAAEYASILAQFDSAPNTWHTRTIDGVVYTFQYANRPRVLRYHGDRRDVQTIVRAYV